MSKAPLKKTKKVSAKKKTTRAGATKVKRATKKWVGKVRAKKSLTSKKAHSPKRQTQLYYQLGGVALVLGVIFLGYKSYFNTSSDSPMTAQLGAIQNSHHQNSQVASSETSLANWPLEKEFTHAREMPVSERVRYWGSLLEEMPEARVKVKELGYQSKTLLSSPIQDVAPIVPDQFDCTTYVETVLALAKSTEATHFIKNLMMIRYENGEPTFLKRNHFPEADWIPNNVKAQVIKDVTAEVAGASGIQVAFETKLIDRGSWLQTQVRTVQRIPANIAADASSEWKVPEEVRLPYIPVQELSRVAPSIPDGAVINFVNRSNPKYPVLITHQGFIEKKGKVAYLRHASVGGKIKTVALDQYIQSMQSRHKFHPLIGVNFNVAR